MDTKQRLQEALQVFAGIDKETFALSDHHWREKHYARGEFYNEYKNVCKHLGFVLDGVFRTYYVDQSSGEEQNVFFCTPGQIVVAYKSFVEQSPCNYFTESMTPSAILYIHIDSLKELYGRSHHWERFGRLVAEKAFSLAMAKAESYMFRNPEERYLEMMAHHPDIFNHVPLYHIASYLGIQGPSLSRIRKRMMQRPGA